MPRSEQGKPIRFTGGMNMLAPDYAMPDGSLRDATNLDVTNEGVLRTRQGHAATPLVPGTSCHSLYGTPQFMLHADRSALKRTASGTDVVATVQNGARIAYATLPTGAVVWSDGSAIGKVSASGVSVPLSLPAAGAPQLAAVANGTLRAGRYTVAVAWVDASGQESPPSLPVALDVEEGQGIQLSSIPASPPAGVAALRIYVSHADEAALFEAGVIAAGVTGARIDAEPIGRPLETLFEAPFPACSALAFAAGRLLGARGNTLYWSEPHRYGVTRPAANFIQFSAPISLIAPTQDGIYVGTLDAWGTGEVVFLSGFDFGKQAFRPVTPFGAYPGTLAEMPHTLQMIWASPQGFVVADNSGQVSAISADKVAFPQASRGGSFVREQDGIRQIITSLEPVGTENPFIVSDYAEAEIIKGASNV